MTGQESEPRKVRTWHIADGVAVYLAAFGAFAGIAVGWCGGRWLMLTMLWTECAVLACATALLGGMFDARALGVGRAIVRVMACVGALSGASVIVLAVARVAWGALPFSAAVLGQIVILAFCLFLASAICLLRRIGSELFTAQFVSMVVACALMGTVFYADPVVEAARGPESRSAVIEAAMNVNPLVAMSWSLVECDVMRRQVMYDRISVIGRWYQFGYPVWWKVGVGYGVAAGVMGVAGAFVRRKRRGQSG